MDGNEFTRLKLTVIFCPHLRFFAYLLEFFMLIWHLLFLYFIIILSVGFVKNINVGRRQKGGEK